MTPATKIITRIAVDNQRRIVIYQSYQNGICIWRREVPMKTASQLRTSRA